MSYLIILSTRYICALIIVHKACKIKPTKHNIIFFSLCTIIISCTCSFLEASNIPFYILLFIILTIISVLIKFKRYYLFIPASFISSGISYFFEIIGVIIIGSIFYFFKCDGPDIFSDILTSIIQLSLTILLFKIKRMASGFRFFENKNNFGVGLLISGPILVLEGIYKKNLELNTNAFLLFALLISAFGLFLWIRSAITRYYRKSLKAKAEEYSKLELAEKKKETEKLLNENLTLSSIIHLDNYLIDTLETTLNILHTNPENSKAINTLRILTKQRNEFVNDKIIKDKILPTTGNSVIDTVFTDIYIKSVSRGIDFNLNVDCDVNYLIHNIIEQADFENLIRSITTNSIVDIESNPDTNGKIMITLTMPNDIYEFTILDNGVVSEDNINSILETINKSNASIRIKEFNNMDSFTKAITIRFDGLRNNNTKGSQDI